MARPRKDPKQLPLFNIDPSGQLGPPVTARPPLTAESSLASAISEWEEWMALKRFSIHTIKSFRNDLNLMARFHGRATAINKFGTKELHDFLVYLREGRNVPCSPKSYQRRITSLKNFFKWLYEEQIIVRDPAAPLIHEPVRIPLPEILYDDEIETLLTTAEALRYAEEKPDARPYLLFTLLLKTAMKKSEAVGIALEHLDFSHPEEPVVYIRYSNPRYSLKERKLALPLDFPRVYDEYIAQHKVEDHLFECTPRNLEYVLQGLAEAAGLSKQVSFEMVRMTCAVRDCRAGMDPDLIRRKLGLSEITWRETGARVEQLAAPAL
ncbi:MAG: tyrosine-type recombinase/integrase [Ardenticatenales bacterium]|nr:tyrosine-type recombinase/integrase [Ardenticatenales bacterium]